MKVAVIKLGSRISYSAKDTSGGNGEAKSIIDMLHKGGADVHIYTKIIKRDKVFPKHLTFHEIRDNHAEINKKDYNALVILNGNVNFFGGGEPPEQLYNYKLINGFKGKVFYIYCDPALTLKQIWKSVAKKPWASKWKQSDIEITREDIVYISQPYNLKEVEKLQKKAGINIARTVHYPFEKFPCLRDIIPVKENPSIDLAYGGTMRGNKRKKKMVKFYFGYSTNLKVQMFGKMDEKVLNATVDKFFAKGLNPPEFSGPVNYNEFMQKMNDCVSHVVIGDPWYEGNDMPQRCYESIWSNVITFIDDELDPQRRVYGNSRIAEILYVKDQQDVEQKLKRILIKKGLREKILELQFHAVNFDAESYCKDFVSLLK